MPAGPTGRVNYIHCHECHCVGIVCSAWCLHLLCRLPVLPLSHVPRSTDSELRRWDYGISRTTKVYQGHVNEKNFVGLSVHASGNYIACGEGVGVECVRCEGASYIGSVPVCG